MKSKLNKKTLLSAAVAAGILGWVAYGVTGCELIAAVDRTKIGNNTGGSGGTVTDGGGGTGATGGATGGGGGDVCVDTDCPGNTSNCRAPACDANDECGFENQPAQTSCNDSALPCDENDASDTCICDGAGECVQCVTAADCAGEDLCSNGGCIDAACTDGTLNNGETATGSGSGNTDGDGAGNDCGGPNCNPCVETMDCALPTDCLSKVCNTGAGGAGGGPIGTCEQCTLHTQCPSGDYCNTNGNPDRCVADLAVGMGNECGALPDSPGNGDEECVGNANCVDGYCCDGACSQTCQFCGTAGTLGVCTTVAVGLDPGNDCTLDQANCVAATCSGTVGLCDDPGGVCRAGSGDPNGSGTVCDPDESCDGDENTAGCPSDTVLGSGTTCRAGSGNPNGGLVCDAEETCSGTAGVPCPTDTILGAGTVCRAGSGDPNGSGTICDPDETCSGNSGQACAADNILGAGTTCRSSAGPCDAVETCNGSAGVACAADGFIGAGLNSSPDHQTCGMTGMVGGCCDGTGTSAAACGTGNCANGEQCDDNGDCTNTCDVGNTDLCIP